MNEIKDPVAGRVHARNEGGPGHRAERRHGGGQRLEIPFFGKRFEVGQDFLVHKLLQKLRIQTVNPQNEHFPGGWAVAGTSREDEEDQARQEASTGHSCSSG